MEQLRVEISPGIEVLLVEAERAHEVEEERSILPRFCKKINNIRNQKKPK